MTTQPAPYAGTKSDWCDLHGTTRDACADHYPHRLPAIAKCAPCYGAAVVCGNPPLDVLMIYGDGHGYPKTSACHCGRTTVFRIAPIVRMTAYQQRAAAADTVAALRIAMRSRYFDHHDRNTLADNITAMCETADLVTVNYSVWGGVINAARVGVVSDVTLSAAIARAVQTVGGVRYERITNNGNGWAVWRVQTDNGQTIRISTTKHTP